MNGQHIAPAEVEGLTRWKHLPYPNAHKIITHPEGEWVRQEDAAALQAENERMREAADASDGNDIWRFWNGRAKALMERAHDLKARAEKAEAVAHQLADALNTADTIISDYTDIASEEEQQEIDEALAAYAKLKGDV